MTSCGALLGPVSDPKGRNGSGPTSPSYLELIPEDGTDANGYLCPVEQDSKTENRKAVCDPTQNGQQGNNHFEERPPSFNQHQDLPKPPPEDVGDARVVEDKNAKGQTLSDDPLLALTIEHDLDDSSDIETSPAVEPYLPVLALASEVENTTIERAELAESTEEKIFPKYYLATDV